MNQTYDVRVIEAVAQEYEPKIRAFLERLRGQLHDLGYDTTDVIDLTDDEFRWSVSTTEDGAVGDDCVDFTLEIAEAKSYGDDPETGINFGLTIVEYGGRILGQLQPYNFTPEVWVDARDKDAIAARWQIFDNADLSEIGGLMP